MITDLAKEVDATEKEHSSNIDQIRGDIKLLKGELNLMKATRNQIVEKGDLSDKEIEQFDTWVKKCISNIAVKEKELSLCLSEKTRILYPLEKLFTSRSSGRYISS